MKPIKQPANQHIRSGDRSAVISAVGGLGRRNVVHFATVEGLHRAVGVPFLTYLHGNDMTARERGGYECG